MEVPLDELEDEDDELELLEEDDELLELEEGSVGTDPAPQPASSAAAAVAIPALAAPEITVNEDFGMTWS